MQNVSQNINIQLVSLNVIASDPAQQNSAKVKIGWSILLIEIVRQGAKDKVDQNDQSCSHLGRFMQAVRNVCTAVAVAVGLKSRLTSADLPGLTPANPPRLTSAKLPKLSNPHTTTVDGSKTKALANSRDASSTNNAGALTDFKKNLCAALPTAWSGKQEASPDKDCLLYEGSALRDTTTQRQLTIKERLEAYTARRMNEALENIVIRGHNGPVTHEQREKILSDILKSDEYKKCVDSLTGPDSEKALQAAGLPANNLTAEEKTAAITTGIKRGVKNAIGSGFYYSLPPLSKHAKDVPNNLKKIFEKPIDLQFATRKTSGQLENLESLGRVPTQMQIISEFADMALARDRHMHRSGKNIETIKITAEMVEAFKQHIITTLGDATPSSVATLGGGIEFGYNTVWEALATIPDIEKNGTPAQKQELNDAIRRGLENGRRG